MTRSIHKRAAAFTLVEAMFAAAVLALAVIGMIQALAAGSEMLDVSRKQTVAANIIQGQIDYLRLCNWTEILALADAVTVPVDGTNQAANVAAGFVFGSRLPGVARGFSCARKVETVRTDLKKITFTVSWKGSTGRSYTRSGSTYVGRNGLNVSYQRS